MGFASELSGPRGVHDYSAAFSPDGRFYTDGGDDNVIQIFETESGKMLRSIKMDGWVQSLDFSPDGRTLLAAAFQRQLHLYDVQTGKDLARFKGQGEPGLEQSVLSPDGRLALSVHTGGKLLLWEVKTGAVLARPAETTRRFGFCFTPDGLKMLVAGMEPQGVVLRLCDASSGAIERKIPLPVRAMPVFVGCEKSDSGLFYAACSDGTVFWSKLSERESVRKLALPNPIQDGCVALSSDGRKLLTGHPDNALRLWSFPGGELIERVSLGSVPTGPPKFSPDGSCWIANSFRGQLSFHRIPRPGEVQATLVRRLSGKASAMAVGGAGRYLLLKLKGERRLVIFDAGRADVSAVVELADDDALITANAANGFAAYPKLRVLDRIDLESGCIDRSSAFPFEATPRVILAGSAATGPVFSVFQAGPADQAFAQPVFGFLSPDDLGPIALRTLQIKGDKGASPGSIPPAAASGLAEGKQGEYRASASGDVLALHTRTPSPVLALNGDAADMFQHTLGTSRSLLAANASRKFYTKTGRVDSCRQPVLATLSDPGTIISVIPSHDPAYYMVIRSGSPPPAPGNSAVSFLEVYSAASDRRLFVVNGLAEMRGAANSQDLPLGLCPISLDPMGTPAPSPFLLRTTGSW